MSTRSCLLCGRTLSRWTAAGDDFCSREHRNQYRLRRSMDRLQEANQVATVMRRRETPRPLKASRLINGGAQEPRGFFAAKTLTAAQGGSVPRLAPACQPRLTATAGSVAIPLTASGSAMHSICPAPVAPRSKTATAMPLRVAMPAPSPQSAPPVRGTESRAAATQMRRRLLPGVWRNSAKPVVDGVLRRIDAPRVYPMAKSARAEALGGGAKAAAKGRVLRVSLAAGFRIPEWKMPPVQFPAPATARMIWPGPHALQARPHGATAAEVASMATEVARKDPEMSCPAAPPADFQGVFRWPGARQVNLTFVNPATLHRTASVPFSSSEEYAGKEHSYEYRN